MKYHPALIIVRMDLKFCKESMMHKTDAAILLIKNALNAGIKADYVLMDTWFTAEPMIKEILETGIHAIGMVKQLKQRYTYIGKQYKLPELKKFVSFEGARNIFGSLVVTTKTGIPVKIVFVQNRNKKSECLYILSTDITLEEAEFYMFCEDIQDLDLTNALQSLMALFVEHISTLSGDITSCIKSKVTEWMLSQASFIQALFGNICWES